MEHWRSEPDEHDYPAAREYLSLVLTPSVADRTVDCLRRAELATYKAKDLLRASGLALLPSDDPHVAADLAKVKKGHHLSPVLLVRGQLGAYALVVADGYHRICASYHLDENAEIPGRIANVPR